MSRRPQPDPLPGATTHTTRRWCRACGRELTHPDSRARGYGPTCDPTQATGQQPDHDIDQDPIPGT